jgi:regulation of enolase protein 1 (concanavalin A-like superfamily)
LAALHGRAAGHICQVLDISEKDFVIETSFLLTPLNQFDQAGLIVHFNADCWVKTGLEYVDGKARLSCVVTNNGYSDWSTQPWPTFELRIRLYKLKHKWVC